MKIYFRGRRHVGENSDGRVRLGEQIDRRRAACAHQRGSQSGRARPHCSGSSVAIDLRNSSRSSFADESPAPQRVAAHAEFVARRRPIDKVERDTPRLIEAALSTVARRPSPRRESKISA